MASLLNTYNNHNKEKSDIILEPLQAIFQLALLSHCDIGSKISIHNNILYIQCPSWTQALVRTYYSDNKEELYFLFNVINRFPIFYNYLRIEDKELYDILVKNAVSGIELLIKTYSNTKITLKHTLEMYKLCLLEPEKYNTQIIKDNQEKNKERRNSNASNNSNRYYSDEQEEYYSDGNNEMSENDDFNSDNDNQEDNDDNKETNNVKGIDINDVFINITKLYNRNHINIIKNILILLNDTESIDAKMSILNGVNYIFKPLNEKIHNWIQEKIVLS